MSGFSSRFGRGHFGLNTTNTTANPATTVVAQPWLQNTFVPRRFNDEQQKVDATVNLGNPIDFWNLSRETNSPLVHGPEASMLRKFKGPKDPLAAEAHAKTISAPPQVAHHMKQQIYQQMMANASPAEALAIEIARKQDYDKQVTAEIDEQFAKSFQNWILKRGRREDHIRAGWWDAKDKKVPKFLSSGGLLSSHPSVKAYVEDFVLSRPQFEQKLVEMKMEALTAGVEDWPIDKLYLYYKYVVRGLEIDDADLYVHCAPAAPPPVAGLPPPVRRAAAGLPPPVAAAVPPPAGAGPGMVPVRHRRPEHVGLPDTEPNTPEMTPDASPAESPASSRSSSRASSPASSRSSSRSPSPPPKKKEKLPEKEFVQKLVHGLEVPLDTFKNRDKLDQWYGAAMRRIHTKLEKYGGTDQTKLLALDLFDKLYAEYYEHVLDQRDRRVYEAEKAERKAKEAEAKAATVAPLPVPPPPDDEPAPKFASEQEMSEADVDLEILDIFRDVVNSYGPQLSIDDEHAQGAKSEIGRMLDDVMLPPETPSSLRDWRKHALAGLYTKIDESEADPRYMFHYLKLADSVFDEHNKAHTARLDRRAAPPRQPPAAAAPAPAPQKKDKEPLSSAAAPPARAPALALAPHGRPLLTSSSARPQFPDDYPDDDDAPSSASTPLSEPSPSLLSSAPPQAPPPAPAPASAPAPAPAPTPYSYIGESNSMYNTIAARKKADPDHAPNVIIDYPTKAAHMEQLFGEMDALPGASSDLTTAQLKEIWASSERLQSKIREIYHTLNGAERTAFMSKGQRYRNFFGLPTLSQQAQAKNDVGEPEVESTGDGKPGEKEEPISERMQEANRLLKELEEAKREKEKAVTEKEGYKSVLEESDRLNLAGRKMERKKAREAKEKALAEQRNRMRSEFAVIATQVDADREKDQKAAEEAVARAEQEKLEHKAARVALEEKLKAEAIEKARLLEQVGKAATYEAQLQHLRENNKALWDELKTKPPPGSGISREEIENRIQQIDRQYHERYTAAVRNADEKAKEEATNWARERLQAASYELEKRLSSQIRAEAQERIVEMQQSYEAERKRVTDEFNLAQQQLRQDVNRREAQINQLHRFDEERRVELERLRLQRDAQNAKLLAERRAKEIALARAHELEAIAAAGGSERLLEIQQALADKKEELQEALQRNRELGEYSHVAKGMAEEAMRQAEAARLALGYSQVRETATGSLFDLASSGSAVQPLRKDTSGYDESERQRKMPQRDPNQLLLGPPGPRPDYRRNRNALRLGPGEAQSFLRLKPAPKPAPPKPKRDRSPPRVSASAKPAASSSSELSSTPVPGRRLGGAATAPPVPNQNAVNVIETRRSKNDLRRRLDRFENALKLLPKIPANREAEEILKKRIAALRERLP